MFKIPSPLIFRIQPEIAHALKNLQKAINHLAEVAGHKQKKFTLDGRLVGDIGEVMAAYFFKIELTQKQRAGFDATITQGPNQGKSVEVKCRRAEPYSDIGF